MRSAAVITLLIIIMAMAGAGADDRAQAEYDEGNQFLNQYLNREAIECFDRALRYDPRHSDALCGKGQALARMRKMDEAFDCFNKAVKYDPANYRAWFFLGSILGGKGEHEKAVACFDTILRGNTGPLDAANALACRIDPNQGVHWLWKGHTLYYLKRYSEAKTAYGEAASRGEQEGRRMMQELEKQGY
jgi:tetratricopeptide (TPR) repeat protein